MPAVKKLQVVVLSCPFLAWSHTLTFCKKYLCSKKLKYGINYSWTCVFYYINIFCKKLKCGIKPKFSKDRIRPPLVFFCIFEKNCNDWIKCNLSKSRTKWTGLVSSYFLSVIIWKKLQSRHICFLQFWFYKYEMKIWSCSKDEQT